MTRTLNISLLIVTVLVMVTGPLLNMLDERIIYGVSILIMCLTGLPHGAVDHLIYQTTQSDRQQKDHDLVRFFSYYLGLMGLIALLWWSVPAISFLLFLFLSFYHFGQSQFFYFKLRERSLVKVGLYLSWGITLLGSFFIFHWDQIETLLATIPDLDILVTFMGQSMYGIIAISGCIFVVLLFHSLRVGACTLEQALVELATLGCLIALFKILNPILAFTFYFGFWHAGKVLVHEYLHLESSMRGFSPHRFVKALLPFSILSIIGICVVLLVFYSFDLLSSPVLLFLIAISVLTAPHTFVMEKMYQRSRTLFA